MPSTPSMGSIPSKPHASAVGGPMVDDFSEIIAGIRAIFIGLGGFATPPCGGGIFDGIDGVDKIDCVDCGQH